MGQGCLGGLEPSTATFTESHSYLYNTDTIAGPSVPVDRPGIEPERQRHAPFPGAYDQRAGTGSQPVQASGRSGSRTRKAV